MLDLLSRTNVDPGVLSQNILKEYANVAKVTFDRMWERAYHLSGARNKHVFEAGRQIAAALDKAAPAAPHSFGMAAKPDAAAADPIKQQLVNLFVLRGLSERAKVRIDRNIQGLALLGLMMGDKRVSDMMKNQAIDPLIAAQAKKLASEGETAKLVQDARILAFALTKPHTDLLLAGLKPTDKPTVQALSQLLDTGLASPGGQKFLAGNVEIVKPAIRAKLREMATLKKPAAKRPARNKTAAEKSVKLHIA